MLTVTIGFYVWLKSILAGIIFIPIHSVFLVWCVNFLTYPAILTNVPYSSFLRWVIPVSKKSIIYYKLIPPLKLYKLVKIFFRLCSLWLVESSWQWRRVGHWINSYEPPTLTSLWIVILQIRVYAIYGKNKWTFLIFAIMNMVSLTICSLQASGYLGWSLINDTKSLSKK